MKFSSDFLSEQTRAARYYCPVPTRTRGPVHVVCAGWENCRADYHVERRTFPWLALELVIAGAGSVQVAGRRFRLGPGTLFCYGPGIAYEMVSDPHTPLQKYFVDFTGREARQSLAASPLRPGAVRQALYPHELQELYEHILSEGNRNIRLSGSIAGNYLRLLFQKLDQCASGTSAPGGSRALTAYLRSRDYLDKNFKNLPTAEAAATALGMTPETLCRLFRRFAQVGPYQHILRLRLHRAVDLLLGTDLLIKEVGQEIGFSDPFHFSRLFKRIHGVSPEMFRCLRQRLSN